jgi:NAD(P)-dependent dehydrogenase (short-subunit alcohol dehydrogenase family)
MTGDEIEKMWEAVSKKYPLRRPGEPEDVAKAIAFLASNDSSFATGVNFKLDGGYLDSLQLIFE